MLTTPHLLIGVYLVKKIPSLWVALPTAFISHLLFDAFFPHWNPHLFTEKEKKGKPSNHSLTIIFLDALIGGVLFLITSYPLLLKSQFQDFFFLSLGGLMAILPDIIEIPYFFFNSKNKLLVKYINFGHEHQCNTSPFWGMLTQVLFTAAIFYFLLK